MNTQVPLEWNVVFSDQTTFSSNQGSWSEFSDLVNINGASLYLSRQPISEIRVIYDGKHHSLLLEENIPCFASHRWRSSIPGISLWLSTTFGFVRGSLRLLFHISECGVETRIEDAAKPFVF